MIPGSQESNSQMTPFFCLQITILCYSYLNFFLNSANFYFQVTIPGNRLISKKRYPENGRFPGIVAKPQGNKTQKSAEILNTKKLQTHKKEFIHFSKLPGIVTQKSADFRVRLPENRLIISRKSL